MKKREELAVKVAKEIIVKLIETGRLSLTSFDEAWNQVYTTVKESIKDSDD